MKINLEHLNKNQLSKLSKKSLIEKIIQEHQNYCQLKEENIDLLYKIKQLEKYQVLEPMIKEITDPLLKIVKFINTIDNKDISGKKKYYLNKVSNKKYGFLYYVRYLENGKLVPSSWNTHTNDEEQAELFAIENRDRLLIEYHQKHDDKGAIGIKKYGNMYKILNEFYSKDSIYMKTFEQLNHYINDDVRKYYNSIVVNVFIPYLENAQIIDFDDLTSSVIGNFQFYLIEKGKTPKSILRYLNILSNLFTYLVTMGIIESNVFENIAKIKTNIKKYL